MILLNMNGCLRGKKKSTLMLMGPVWEVRNCLRGPNDRDSLLGRICQNPTVESVDIHPWTRISFASIEYWYLSSTFISKERQVIPCLHKWMTCCFNINYFQGTWCNCCFCVLLTVHVFVNFNYTFKYILYVWIIYISLSVQSDVTQST